MAKLQLLNSVPERATERSDLSLVDKEGRTVRIGSAGYHEFDGMVVDLTTLLDVSLELLPNRIER